MARVLAVEGKALLLKLLTRLLERDGHEVHGFLVPQRALEALDQSLELVICDYHLPGVDGLELAARIKRRISSTRTLLLLGELEDPAVSAALESGILDRFLARPYRAEELAEAVRSLVQPPTAAEP